MANIVHLCPFAPHRAGIYEAARDCVVADLLAGHNVGFIDTGVVVGGTRQEPQIGAKDERGAFEIVTGHPDSAKDADVLVMHTGVPDLWVVKNQAPMIWVVHGRPLAAFRPEQVGTLISYSMYADVATWPRTKAMLHFWPEFQPYWDVVFPKEKHVCFDYPPIDDERFAPAGPVHLIGPDYRGEWNGLICDSWREDVDIFEVTHGAIEAAKQNPGLKWHFYAMEANESGCLRPCWEILVNALRKLNALGEVCGRMENMDKVYRGMDFVLTPHKIVTRIIGEAVACGTPVVAAEGCRATTYWMDPSDPKSVARTVGSLILDLKNGEIDEAPKHPSLLDFGKRMSELYQRALNGEPITSVR